MKSVRIDNPDDQAEALDRAAAPRGFASASELLLDAMGDLLSAPPDDHDADALAQDIARHMADKQRGEAALSPDDAHAWLRAARSA